MQQRMFRPWGSFNESKFATRDHGPGRGFYIWGGYSNVSNYPTAIADSGLFLSQIIVG